MPDVAVDWLLPVLPLSGLVAEDEVPVLDDETCLPLIGLRLLPVELLTLVLPLVSLLSVDGLMPVEVLLPCFGDLLVVYICPDPVECLGTYLTSRPPCPPDPCPGLCPGSI